MNGSMQSAYATACTALCSVGSFAFPNSVLLDDNEYPIKRLLSDIMLLIMLLYIKLLKLWIHAMWPM
jgi:hypothetical protein